MTNLADRHALDAGDWAVCPVGRNLTPTDRVLAVEVSKNDVKAGVNVRALLICCDLN